VEFTLPEDNIPEVVSRMRKGEKLKVDAFDRSETTKLASGTLTSVDNQVDPSTGTFKLRATFSNEDGGLFPSQFVNARLLLGVLSNVTIIPTSAVERGEQGSFVYVVQPPQNTAVVKNVQLGVTEGERVQVTSGLEDGDLVVTDGADRIKEGSIVSIQKATDAIPSTGVPKTPRHRKGKKGGWGGGGGWGGSGGQGGGSGGQSGTGGGSAGSGGQSGSSQGSGQGSKQ
jgi:multidrug efflux system membrane fusion protein